MKFHSLITQIIFWILLPVVCIMMFVWFQLDDLSNRFIVQLERDISARLDQIERDLFLVEDTAGQIAKMVARDSKVILAIKNREADFLFRMGKNTIDSTLIDHLTFVDPQGVVLARGHDEFAFNDSIAEDVFFQLAAEGREFSGLTSLGEGAAFVFALPIYEFGTVLRGTIIVARFVSPQLLAKIGNELNLTVALSQESEADETPLRSGGGLAHARKTLRFDSANHRAWSLSVSKSYHQEIVVLEQARREILMFTILATGAVLCFVYVSIRYLLRPLRRLHAVLLRHQDGLLDAASLDTGAITGGTPRNELGFIAVTALTTIRDLEQAQGELRRMHDNLEQLVDLRTGELSRKTGELEHEVQVRKQAEARELGLRNHLQCIFDSMCCVLVVVDTAGRITFVNAEAETLCGMSFQQLKGLSLDAVSHFYGISGCELLERLRHSGDPWQTHRFCQELGERRVCLDMTSYPFRVGENAGFVIRIDDVTRHVAMEQELFKSEKLKAIGLLAGGIAHDFNNVLAVILGNINLVQRDQRLSEESGKYLATAEKAVSNARNLTRQLLTFAQGGEPQKELTDPVKVVRNGAVLGSEGRPVGYRLSSDSGVWPVEIDVHQIEQVIGEMMKNAVQVLPAGAVVDIACANVSVGELASLEGLPPGPYVCITVADSGSGMPGEILSRVFDPYFSTKGSGHGLGLAICYSIIRKHHGMIAVDSRPDQGTVFSIYLPAKPDAHLPRHGDVDDQKGSGPSLRILVMDDEVMIREVVKAMLSLLGHQTVTTSDGVEAVAYYRDSLALGVPPHLVLMDLVVVGGMGGKEATREILGLDPQAKIVVCSGYSDDPVLANCRQFGFAAALAKPYDFAELKRTIDSIGLPLAAL